MKCRYTFHISALSCVPHWSPSFPATCFYVFLGIIKVLPYHIGCLCFIVIFSVFSIFKVVLLSWGRKVYPVGGHNDFTPAMTPSSRSNRVTSFEYFRQNCASKFPKFILSLALLPSIRGQPSIMLNMSKSMLQCWLVPKSCKKPSQRSAGCDSSRLMSILIKYECDVWVSSYFWPCSVCQNHNSHDFQPKTFL